MVTEKGYAPTCSEPGRTDAEYCEICGQIYKWSSAIPALGHNFQWKTTKSAAYTQTGKQVHSCTRCGKIDKETTIPMLPRTSLAKATVTGIANKVYTGKAQSPAPTVKLGKTTLKRNTDYKVTYRNNTNVGKATVTITGMNRYSGTLNRTFVINPKGTAIRSVKAAKKGFILTWNAQIAQNNGYQIQYSMNSGFKSGVKVVTIGNAKTITRKVTKLKSKKNYYVRVRTYKTVGGTKYYSNWSTVRKVKAK